MKARITIAVWIGMCIISNVSLSQEIANSLLQVKFEAGRLEICSKDDQSLMSYVTLPQGTQVCSSSEVADELWGNGHRLELIHDQGNRLSTVTLYEGQPFVHIHTCFKNTGAKPLHLANAEIAALQLKIGLRTEQLCTLGTGGLRSVDKAEGSFTYSVLADPVSRKGIVAGWLTQLQGIGLFRPDYDQAKNTYTVKASLEFGHYCVNPAQERQTDVLVLGFFHDVRRGLETYGDALAKAYNIKLPPKPEVYCTWYHKSLSGSGASNEKVLTANTEFAAEHLKPYGLSVMQIDDHWQDAMLDASETSDRGNTQRIGNGPVKVFVKGNDKFPAGMRHMAEVISANGFTPGIWFMPFAGDTHHRAFDKNIFATDAATGKPYDTESWSGAPIDSTSPEGEAFLRDRFRQIFGWGYKYYKIDGLHTGAPSQNIYVNRAYDGKPIFADVQLADPNMTFVQCFRKGMDILREESPGVFILGCTATQNMLSLGAAFGRVDAMRVGPDNGGAADGKWRAVVKGADFAGNLYFLHNRVWYNDPDPYYIRSSNPINMARWMASWQAVSGAMGTTSEQYADLEPDRLNIMKRALPTHRYNAMPVDILEHPIPRIWTVSNERLTVVGLFNPAESKQTDIDYSLERMGLDAEASYHCFEFWSDEYLGQIKGRHLKRSLAPASCQVLALRQAMPHPQVISTSRHITQGLVDLHEESWDASSNTLKGASEMVKEDPYELRIAVPAAQWKALSVEAPGCTVSSVLLDGRVWRVVLVPQRSGAIQWQVSFDKAENKP